jgi:hypothetical protein
MASGPTPSARPPTARAPLLGLTHESSDRAPLLPPEAIPEATTAATTDVTGALIDAAFPPAAK